MIFRRWLELLRLAAVMVVLSGCSKPTTSTTTTSKNSGGKETSPEPSKPGAAAAVAKAFVKSLETGSPDLTKLSTDFKKLIAPPVSASDKEKGYSDWAVTEWFKAFGKSGPTGEPQEVELASGVAVAQWPGTATTGPVVLKLSKTGSDWLIDWVHVGPRNATTKLENSNKAAEFVAHQLLQTALANQLELSETLLTKSLKSRIAPPLPGDVDYNKSILKSKIGQLGSNAISYAFSKVNIGADSGTIDGTLTLENAGKPGETRPVSLKLVKGTKPGEWLIDDFDPR